jgi:phosphatidylethanolamine-binding protein (PEBP) family uncharacterized protein
MLLNKNLKNLLRLSILIFHWQVGVAFAMEINWNWKLSHRCTSISPAIRVSGIPSGTATLEFIMKDYDAPRFEHGGGRIVHDSKTEDLSLIEGALKNYRGPCPPNFNSFGHDYEITVYAIGSDGKTLLGSASNKKNFSSANVKN